MISHYLTDSDNRRRVLSKLIQEGKLEVIDKKGMASLLNKRDSPYFNFQADTILLAYILNKAQIDLNKVSSKTIDDEVENWNRPYLADLAENIEVYTRDEVTLEKFQYIISHSISGNLVTALASGKSNDKFASYNSHVLKRLDELGINTSLWLTHGQHLEYFSSPDNKVILEMKEWTRDFRREFAMGNISECCITTAVDSKHVVYQPVLLDIFLDLSIQAVLLNGFFEPFTGNHTNKEFLGQMYYVAFEGESEYKDRPILGVTSVELASRYRNDTNLVWPIGDSILDPRRGYEHLNGFNSTLVGMRFYLFRKYLHDISQGLQSVITRVGQRGSDYKKNIASLTDKIRNIEKRGQGNPEDIPTLRAKKSIYEERLKEVNTDLALLMQSQKSIYSEKRMKLKKIGLNYAVETKESFLGTNYLDILAESDDPKAGFFKPYNHRSFQASGHFITDEGPFYRVDALSRTMFSKYPSRKNKKHDR
jgi:hypothetical protein